MWTRVNTRSLYLPSPFAEARLPLKSARFRAFGLCSSAPQLGWLRQTLIGILDRFGPSAGIEAAIVAVSLLKGNSMSDSSTDQIRNFNDAFRTSLEGGQIFITSGVSERGPSFVLKALAAVRSFETFTEGNDPYGEHDFGAIEIEGERLFWKIDYYDLACESGSIDPSDPALTRRVLTILLADEY